MKDVHGLFLSVGFTETRKKECKIKKDIPRDPGPDTELLSQSDAQSTFL